MPVMACSSINRQAIGIVEQLDKPLYEVIRPKSLVPNDKISSPATCAGVTENGFHCSPEQADDRVETDVVEVKPQVFEITGPVPRVLAVETHGASLVWEAVDFSLLESGSDQLDSVTYELEVQQLDYGASPPDTSDAKGQACGWRDADWKCSYVGKQRSAKVTSLRPGRCYIARIRYRCPTIESTQFVVEPVPSAVVHFKTISTAPGPPQPPSLSARARNNLKFKWNTPEETGGEYILYYLLQMSPPPLGQPADTSGEGYTEVYRGVEKSFKVSKLQPGVRYTVRVKAVNKIGDGPYSLCSVYTTQASVPSIPEPPDVVSVTSDSVSFRWRAPADNGAPLNCYVLEKDDGMGGDFQHAYAGLEHITTVKNLQSGAQYRFRLRADNDEGRGAWCQPVLVRTAASAPGSPSPMSILETHKTTATISWSAPSVDGGSEVTGFEVQLQAKTKAAASVMGSDWLTIFNGYATACSINSLIAGCTYRTRVRAGNSAGFGQWSIPIELTTLPEVPLAPYDLETVDVSSDSLVIKWETPVHDGGSKITSYRLDVAPVVCTCASAETCTRPSNDDPSFADEYKPAYTGLDNTARVTGLTPGTDYKFRVQAHNNEGPGPWSQSQQFTTSAAPPLPPAAPLAVQATSSLLVWRWSVPQHRGAAVLSYAAETVKLDNKGIGPSAAEPSASETSAAFEFVYKGPDVTCEVKGLEPHTTYGLRVKACNSVGWSDWGELGTATTGASVPGAPEAMQATGVESSELAVSWDPPQRDNGSPIVSYLLEYSLQATSSSGGSIATSRRSQPSWVQCYQGSRTSFVIKQLLAGKSYQIRVRASNSNGVGPYSVVISAPTLPSPPYAPPKPTITEKKATSVRVKWQLPDEDNGAPVSSYVLQVAANGAEFSQAYAGADMCFKVTGLLPGSKYSIRVAAVNSAGIGEFSEPESVLTALLPPGPPQNLSVEVVPLSSEYSVLHARWELSEASSSTADAIGYEVAVVPDGVLASAIKQTVGRVLECQFNNMAPGTSFSVRMRAVGADGTGHSAWSDPVLVQTPGVKRVFLDARSESSETSSLISLDSGRGNKLGKKKKGAVRRSAANAEQDMSELSMETRIRKSNSEKHLKVAPVVTVAARAPPKRYLIHPKIVRVIKQAFIAIVAVAVIVLLFLAASG